MEDRERRLRRVIGVEGIANALAALVKAGIGLATGSYAVLGDALHSLTDLANNGIAWLVVGWSADPPDSGHPYGHRKFETVAVFGLAMLLVVTAIELALGALRRATSPVHDLEGGAWGLLALAAANASLSAWQAVWARRLGSDLLRADARHTLGDALTTVAALVGWQAAVRGHLWADTAVSVVVAAVILTLAYGLFRRSLPILVDQASLDVAEIERVAGSVPGVLAVRDARSRSYGTQSAIDLTVLVSADMDLGTSHGIASRVERALEEAFSVLSVTVHVEPLDGPPS